MKIQSSKLFVVSALLISATTSATPVSAVLVECQSYLKDTGTRIQVIQTKVGSAKATHSLVHEEMTSNGYQLASRHQVAVFDRGLSDDQWSFFVHSNANSLEIDLTQLISDRWGNPGHPGRFLTSQGETLAVKCTVFQ